MPVFGECDFPVMLNIFCILKIKIINGYQNMSLKIEEILVVEILMFQKIHRFCKFCCYHGIFCSCGRGLQEECKEIGISKGQEKFPKNGQSNMK